MAPNYKLTYFNSRGLAEFSRLILAYLGLDYEDVRIERENWPELKPKTPFHQIPILEVDGHIIAQSRAIARFLAREHGLAGKNNIEAAICDGLVDGLFDLFAHLREWIQEADEAKKKELADRIKNETLPPYLDIYSNLLSKNNGGTGYFVGNELTWADIAVAHFLWMLNDVFPNALDKHQSLIDFKERVLNIPKIKAWIDSRPKTQY